MNLFRPTAAFESIEQNAANVLLQKCIAVIFILLPALVASAKDVKLVWTASPDTNVTGYNIYYVYDCSTNTTPMNCTNVVDVGDVTAAVITGLDPSTAYCFAATAYDALGDESDYSNWLPYTTPAQLSIGAWPCLIVPGAWSSNLATPLANWQSTNFYFVLPGATEGNRFFRFASAPRMGWTTNQP